MEGWEREVIELDRRTSLRLPGNHEARVSSLKLMMDIQDEQEDKKLEASLERSENRCLKPCFFH